jgi:hypothetical protein
MEGPIMRLKHGIITLSALCLLSAGFSAGVIADSVVQKVEAYLRPDVTIKVNGTAMEQNQPFVIYKDTGYLPVRALAEALNADIVWTEQTIYVNQRIHDTQPKTSHKEDKLQEIYMDSSYGIELGYLGRTYPVYVVYFDGLEYYRLSDLKRMGIDDGPLRKMREAITQELFVSASEVEKVWKEQPKLGYAASPLVTGETNEKKIQAMVSYAPPYYNPQMNYQYSMPMVLFVIDAGDQENEFTAIGMRENKYYRIQYKLSSKEEVKLVNQEFIKETVWNVDNYSIEYLADHDYGYSRNLNP